jgi:hypothetical protein
MEYGRLKSKNEKFPKPEKINRSSVDFKFDVVPVKLDLEKNVWVEIKSTKK